jgi:parallel beta-helix repeat protein
MFMTSLILPPGTLLQGRYLIERLIAQGGMGAVYQATDQRLGSTVALKQIMVGDTRMRKAFEREARLLASLQHMALPVVSDHFTEETGQFLVMQFIAGDDLGTLLERKSDTFTTVQAFPQIMTWIDQLLDALDYLHTHNPPIVHRDIKPQNLKLTSRGGIILLDFGLAKGAVNQGLSTTARSVRAYTTQYAPLEQIQGTGTEPRSDLYALAATFYHLLTGETPPNSLTRASAVLAGAPDPLIPINKLNPYVSPGAAAILHQAMAHGIAKRFASAAAMRTALRMVYQNPHDMGPQIDSGGQKTIVLPPSGAVAPREQQPAVTRETPTMNMAPAPPILVVAQSEQGHYQTISAAIANAQPGSRILIRPGLYQEQIILDKSLEINGDGAPADIVIANTDAACLVMHTDHATVRGLSLRGHVSEPRAATQPTVEIPQGRLSLENCDITTEGRLGLAIHGASANPIIWRCQIRDSKGIGVMVYGRGRGTLEECNISGHAQACIAIRQGATPTIRLCKIYRGAQDGIYVDEKGLGTIEECEIWENVRAGIEIKRGSSPFIRRCKIFEQTQGYGIYICDRGEGYVEECEIAGNARAGFAITQGSNPLVRRCSVHHEKQRGMLFSEYGQGMIEQCTISGNRYVGVEIKQGSSPTLRNCKINHHNMVAIWVHQKGAGHVERCDLTGNTRGAWQIEEGSQVSRRGNKE